MSKPARQHNVPFLIATPEERAVPLEPVSMGSPPFREDYLQKMLADYPEVLPVSEIEPAFAPLIFLGREIQTPSGYLDALFASPLGYLTLVEAKLWDNPQSRREVVGQIVEYAKDFSHWTFDELDAAVRGARGKGSPGILEIVREHDPDLDVSAFIDTVSRNLRRGTVLLLVVGNGIRESVEALAEFLGRTPSLHFSLALVELALYRLAPDQEWPIIVQPRTVARTMEVVRAVVEVIAPPGIDVRVDLPSDEPAAKARSRRSISEDAFFSELMASSNQETAEQVRSLLESLEELGLVPKWRATGVSMRLPDPGGLSKHWTVLFVGTDAKFYLGFLGKISEGGYDRSIWQRYLDATIRLTGADKYDKIEDGTRPMPIGRLFEHRPEFMSLVDEFIRDLRLAADASA